MGGVPGQGRKVIFVSKTRQRHIRLRLQIDRLNPSGVGSLQLGHAPTFQQIGHKGGDENGLTRAAETRHPKPHHGLLKQTKGRGSHPVQPALHAFAKGGENQRRLLSSGPT